MCVAWEYGFPRFGPFPFYIVFIVKTGWMFAFAGVAGMSMSAVLCTMARFGTAIAELVLFHKFFSLCQSLGDELGTSV